MRIKEKVCYVLAAVFLLLGVLMRFVFTAVRFTGFLLCCAAAALVLYALLDRWGQRHAWARWCKRTLLLFLAAGVLLFTVLEAWVISKARTEQDVSPEAIVILGAGVNGTEPSLSLEKRLETAFYYIMQEWPETPVVVTGSQGPDEEISEAACMAQWLTGRGVPEERIVLEEQAGTTEENVRYSKELLAACGIPEGAEVAIVTSDYHLCRAAWLWGEGAVTVAAYMPEQYWPLTLNYYVREAFAMAAALFL